MINSRFKPPTPNDLVKGWKSFWSLFSVCGFKPKPNVNSVLLKLHSTATSVILMCALTLLSMNAYFGDSIECNSSKSDIPPAQIVRYCWMEGSFSAYRRVKDHREHSELEDGYPGVKTPSEDDKIIYHRYYQWVYFVLIFQSFMFYMPKYVWRRHESCRLTDLIEDLRDNHIAALYPFDKYRLLQDVADSMYIGSTFLTYFVLCDFLCFLNLIAQIWLTNLFLGGGFVGLGFEWYSYTVSDTRKHTDPLLRIFPRQVKCTYHKYGFSGTQERIDSLCLLPQNIVNEKIYLFLWAWFMFLLGFTVLVLGVRLFYYYPFFRYCLLQQNAPCYAKIKLRRLCVRLGNWFVLYSIAKNIKPSYFVDLLEELLEVHFDKNGQQQQSTIFRDQLANRVKVELKRRAPRSKAPKPGWKVDNKTNYNTSNDFTYNNYSNTNYNNDYNTGYSNDYNTGYSNDYNTGCTDNYQHQSVSYEVRGWEPDSSNAANDNNNDNNNEWPRVEPEPQESSKMLETENWNV